MCDVTINERNEIADFMRVLGTKGFQFDYNNIASAINANYVDDESCWLRLAELINPPRDITLKDVHFWAFDNLEDCDDTERSLYENILDAIQDYYDELYGVTEE